MYLFNVSAVALVVNVFVYTNSTKGGVLLASSALCSHTEFQSKLKRTHNE